VPTANVPRTAPDPVPPSNEFKTDAPLVSAGRRYRRNNGAGKMVWVAVCLFLTAGLVTAGIFGARYLNNKFANEKKEPPSASELVLQLGGTDASKRDAAYNSLKEMGIKAESALKEGLASGNHEIAGRCKELLVALTGSGSGPGVPTPVTKAAAFPRRMLFIHISRYMYMNPLTYAQVLQGGSTGADRSKSAASRLAFEWLIPNDPKSENNQLFVLSDTAQPDNSKAADVNQLPMKNVVVGAYERFFETSRAQDRIVLYFGGHAFEKEGKAYIASIEGDPDDVEATMIPLSDFYDKLKACKATQKIVIWDVCRFNPDRGRQRPGSDPMSESLYKALATAPEGVEVVVTCSPGENALEFNNLQVTPNRNSPHYGGSSFLESMREVLAKSTRSPGKQPTAADPIPASDWATAVAKQTAEVASLPTVNLKQTVKYEGKMKANQVAFNADEAPAKRFDLPPAPRGVPSDEIGSIVTEFNVPPIKRDLVDTGLSALAFREDVMKDYKADVPLTEILKNKENYKLRAMTITAFEKIRKMWAIEPGATGGPPIREEFKQPVNDALKKEIKREQDFWAIGIAELELINIELDAVASLKDAEPKRWQANYEYARAVIKARLAYMNEFNKLMGDVQTETLPPLDMKLGQDGYKLASNEKMKSKKDVQKIAEEAKEAYEKLITEHKGTPWAIQAKRDKSFTLGLQWQPYSFAGGGAVAKE
jgi:hypothetical protein